VLRGLRCPHPAVGEPSEPPRILRQRRPERQLLGVALGTNKRYSDSIDRRMNARIAEREVAGLEPFSLTDEELELATETLTLTPVPRAVRAWDRFGQHAIKVDAEAVAWTGRAVAIKWAMPNGIEHRAWVWASAVEPR
jgi:hypothetical protein